MKAMDLEQALKSLEPSQQEIRHAFERASGPDHLSCAGVPPEEEASLIEALL